MQLFLHIKISNDRFVFKNDAIRLVKEWMPQIAIFDIDNFSDTTTIQTAIRAIEMSERIFIQIEAEPVPELGGVLKILMQLIKLPSPIAIYYNGHNDKLDKIMVRFRDMLCRDNSDLQQEVKSFFKG